MKIELQDDQAIIHLGEILTLNTINEQLETLKQAHALKKPIIFNGSAITKIDTASLQLLLCLILMLQKENTKWQWQGISKALQIKATMLGFNEYLHLPSGI